MPVNPKGSAMSDQTASADYDVIVIGAGSTGTNAAWYARENGLSCVVVEDELVGGECSYWACMPSKALLGPPQAVAAARRLPGAAAAVTDDVDAGAVLSRRDAFNSGLDDEGQVDWMDSIGADLIRGRGRLAGERTVEVSSGDGSRQTLHARRGVVVATGSRASLPPIDGLRETRVWTNREATSAEKVPARLLVLGGGVVGCEMAQAYHRLGAEQVTIIEMADSILGTYEPWVAELVEQAFDDEGIVISTGATAVKVSRDGPDGPVTVGLDDGSQMTGDELLVAVGRTFNTDDIGLETVGAEPGGPLEVNDRLRVDGVDGDWLYAAGDVNGRAMLTHQGKYQARLVGDILAGKDRSAWADSKAVPQVMFTDPEVAAVGPTEAQAREAGIEVKTVSYDIAKVAGGALAGDGVVGRAALVIDQARRVVIGATFVGPHVGELLHSATIAVVGEVPIDRLWHAVPSFPTISEVWLRLLEADRGV